MRRDQSNLARAGKRSRKGAETCVPVRRARRPLGSLVPLLKALSDEKRLAILELLAGADGQLCACDIEEAIGLAQPTISHHMRSLREAGLVDAEKRGLWVYYSTTPAANAAIEALLSAVNLH